jgi:hypothetical protein
MRKLTVCVCVCVYVSSNRNFIVITKSPSTYLHLKIIILPLLYESKYLGSNLSQVIRGQRMASFSIIGHQMCNWE